MILSNSRGHNIYFDGLDWRYIDTNEEVHNSNRPCARCGHLPTEEGYDYCMGKIEGAISACCGHGLEAAYIVMDKSYPLIASSVNHQSKPYRFQ